MPQFKQGQWVKFKVSASMAAILEKLEAHTHNGDFVGIFQREQDSAPERMQEAAPARIMPVTKDGLNIEIHDKAQGRLVNVHLLVTETESVWSGDDRHEWIPAARQTGWKAKPDPAPAT